MSRRSVASPDSVKCGECGRVEYISTLFAAIFLFVCASAILVETVKR